MLKRHLTESGFCIIDQQLLQHRLQIETNVIGRNKIRQRIAELGELLLWDELNKSVDD